MRSVLGRFVRPRFTNDLPRYSPRGSAVTADGALPPRSSWLIVRCYAHLSRVPVLGAAVTRKPTQHLRFLVGFATKSERTRGDRNAVRPANRDSRHTQQECVGFAAARGGVLGEAGSGPTHAIANRVQLFAINNRDNRAQDEREQRRGLPELVLHARFERTRGLAIQEARARPGPRVPVG